MRMIWNYETKPKLMVCALIFVSGAILNLFFSTAVHGLLTREITRLSLLPIGDCLASLFSNRQAHDVVSVSARVCKCVGGYVLPDQHEAV